MRKINLLTTVAVGTILFSGSILGVSAEELDEAPQEPATEITNEPDSCIPQETISADGVYVLKQGVSSDLDISTSTANSYWTQVDTTAQITFKEDGELSVVKDPNHTAADITIDEDDFIKALNQAVTGEADDDTYTWEYNKVILENNGYHLDCIAYVPEYTVTFVTGTDENIFQGVLRNDTVSAIDYSRDGYEFIGYYADGEFVSEYDFNTKIKNNTNIYLAWVKIEPDEEMPADKPAVDPDPNADIAPDPELPDDKPVIDPEPEVTPITPVTPTEPEKTTETKTEQVENNNSNIINTTDTSTVSTPSENKDISLITIEEKSDVITIPDEQVPVCGAPKTGDESFVLIYICLIASLIGLSLVGYSTYRMAH